METRLPISVSGHTTGGDAPRVFQIGCWQPNLFIGPVFYAVTMFPTLHLGRLSIFQDLPISKLKHSQSKNDVHKEPWGLNAWIWQLQTTKLVLIIRIRQCHLKNKQGDSFIQKGYVGMQASRQGQKRTLLVVFMSNNGSQHSERPKDLQMISLSKKKRTHRHY